jgi:hypothetical protein
MNCESHGRFFAGRIVRKETLLEVSYYVDDEKHMAVSVRDNQCPGPENHMR